MSTMTVCRSWNNILSIHIATITFPNWVFTKRSLLNIESAEIRCLRSVKGYTVPDRISNENIKVRVSLCLPNQVLHHEDV
jgi:hypothetical protein